MRELYFLLWSKIFSKKSLRAITWRHIDVHNKNLSEYREPFYKTFWNKIIRNHKYSLTIFILLPFLLPILCLIPFYKTPLSVIYFADIELNIALDSIKNNLSNSATLIGISFVVLGFIFEIVKDRTHQTFMELSSAIRLFPVMGLAFSILLIHVFINGIIVYLSQKDSFNLILIKNWCICSWFLMICLVISIMILFFKMIIIFNVDAVNNYFKKILIREARNFRVNEVFAQTSRTIYTNTMIKLGLKIAKFRFGETLPDRQQITTKKENEMFFDIDIQKVEKLLLPYKSEAQTNEYYEFKPVQLQSSFNQNEKIFYFPNNKFFSKGRIQNIKSCFKKVSLKSESHLYESHKKTLIEHVHRAIQHKDQKQLNEYLEYMREVYDTLYNTMNKND